MKKAYFFTLDAFIAGTIIATGLLLVLFYRANIPQQTQTINFAEDTMSFFYRTKVSEVNNPYLDNLRKKRIISPDNTLLGQIGDFHYNKQPAQASGFAEEVTRGTIPAQYGYMILINDTLVYSNKAYANDTPFLFSAKRLVFGAINQTDMWVYKAEVRVWQGANASVIASGPYISDCQAAHDLGWDGCLFANQSGFLDIESCCRKFQLCCPP